MKRYLSFLALTVLLFTSCGAQSQKDYTSLTTVKVIKGKDVAALTKQTEYTAVYLWATWCTPCRSTLKKTIRQMMDTVKRDDFQIVVVALSKHPDKVQEIVDKAGISQTTYVVNDYTFDNALGDKMKMNKIIKSINKDVKFLNQVPVVLMVDKDGKVYGDTYSTYDVKRFLSGELK